MSMARWLFSSDLSCCLPAFVETINELCDITTPCANFLRPNALPDEAFPARLLWSSWRQIYITLVLFSLSRTQDEIDLEQLYGDARDSIERTLDTPGKSCSTPPPPLSTPLATSGPVALRRCLCLCSGAHAVFTAHNQSTASTWDEMAIPSTCHICMGSGDDDKGRPLVSSGCSASAEANPTTSVRHMFKPRLPREALAVSAAPRIAPTHTHNQTTLTVLIFICVDSSSGRGDCPACSRCAKHGSP